ncbi:hypothetical protein niasHT_017231 [Heterodera trifolii]|uniref:Uncharacterized protein n=1 Tax=Heterodera trifolii TaxID=157864 RepID=A0ABD2L398_9BILA
MFHLCIVPHRSWHNVPKTRHSPAHSFELEEGVSSSCVTNQSPAFGEKKEGAETDGDEEANVPRCSTKEWHSDGAKR